jgi:NTE family protein
MVVNARSSPSTDWDRIESPPGILGQLLQASSVPIDRYSFDTIETMKDHVAIMNWRRQLAVAQARLAGMSEAAAEASVPKTTMDVVDISFDAIRDPKERAYFMNLPTSFVLPVEDIDKLREVAGQLMRQSVEYESVVRDFGGNPGK